jgi:uncharacterized protein (DUF2147 family)
MTKLHSISFLATSFLATSFFAMSARYRAGLASIGLLAGLCIAPAFAGSPDGIWLRDTGASRVKFAKCGEALCGHIVWLKDTKGPAKLGQRVFYDMKSNGADSWVGKAFNPEDGKTYSGKILLNGDAMITSGCALAGLICKSVNWTRVK